MSFQDNYLESVIKQFEQYKTIGGKSISRVNDDKLNWLPNEESNSITVIVHHLTGNMLSRWTDFLTSDGEKEWRNRDSEFDNSNPNRDKIME